jgi:hypothetical protein
MNRLIYHAAALVVFLAGSLVPNVRAQYLDLIGVSQLQALTTNLNGAGVKVAQPEGGYGAAANWEVNPAFTGQPTNLFTWIAETTPPYPATLPGYFSTPLTASTFTNSLGLESIHADGVGMVLYGNPGGVATNVAHVNNYEANAFFYHYVYYNNTITDRIVSQSFSFGSQSVVNQQQNDSLYDNASVHNKTLFVSAVNNYGTNNGYATNVCAPGTGYNCIGVGAYKNGSTYNSLGPTPDNGRCKPDISAISDVTSDSTPQVAGAAAVLMQAGYRGDGGSDTNSAVDMRTIKALLLNGAVKPADWTNNAPAPLDYRYGAGVLNVFNSYEQLAGGKNGYNDSTGVVTNSPHPPTGAAGTIGVLSGWDFNTNTSSASDDVVKHYYFNATNSPGGVTLTATLVWNRQLNQSAINNLELFLYDGASSNLVASSTSLVDNVQHLFVPRLAPGRYDLQVWKAGGVPGAGIVSLAEPYALAFAFTATALTIGFDGTNAVLSWPVYPAGFCVEATANLAAPAWSTNNLSAATLTGSTNSVPLPATNALQFFRLRQPNF